MRFHDTKGPLLGSVHMGPKSQASLLLASPNIEAKPQLLSLKKPLEYGQLSFKLDLMQKCSQDTWLVLGLVFCSTQPNYQHKSQASPPKSVAM